MKVVIQRCISGNVIINNQIYSEITKGMVILVGFTEGDNEHTLQEMAKKISNLRIFDDENGIMNKSIIDISGEILSVSQFTLYGDTNKGNRPSYMKALAGEFSIKLYESFNQMLNEIVPTKSGLFGADMLLNIQNDGPVTIIIEK